MKKIKNIARFVIPAWLLCFFILKSGGLNAQNTGKLVVRIHPVWRGEALLPGKIYINENGDSLYLDIFKFYLSGLSLSDTKNKKAAEKNSYHLINAEDSSSLIFTFKNIPASEYISLHFSIGVDSLKNVSGALDGDLDPVKGMYWAWNTGYINAKIEGRSNSCKTLHHAFEFHVGGYLAPYNALRKTSLAVPGLKIVKAGTTYLDLDADVAEWFKGSHKIDLSKTNSIVMPGKDALMMADNYVNMFSVVKVSYP